MRANVKGFWEKSCSSFCTKFARRICATCTVTQNRAVALVDGTPGHSMKKWAQLAGSRARSERLD